jgi:oxygen-dependent protoporphyrinogen oxidase
MVGGARDPDAVGLSEAELEELVLREVRPVLDLQGEPRVRKIYRYLQGIPQYNVGHAKRLARVDGWLERFPGLHVTGNAYRGIGINDCVAEAGRLARQLIERRRGRNAAAPS